jgi:tRNA (uracil-5-)-methyltransferase
VPPILPTIASPKTYGYRTKITPHFDLPQQLRKPGKGAKPAEPAKDVPAVDIGFAEKGRRRVMDIEECVIATPIINKALPVMRENVKKYVVICSLEGAFV